MPVSHFLPTTRPLPDGPRSARPPAKIAAAAPALVYFHRLSLGGICAAALTTSGSPASFATFSASSKVSVLLPCTSA